MSKIAWLRRRLQAMSLPEIMWRVDQKRLQILEKKRFFTKQIPVIDHVFNPALNTLRLNPACLGLSMDCQVYSVPEAIPLLGGYDYNKYKKQWHAGFQTQSQWPLEFSYTLDYKQSGEKIGDARTNWELNRHFQFAILAKNYRVTGEKRYLDELVDLFEDWNRQNPFLWGLSWSSVMEIGVRCSSWCYTYCFLDGLAGTAPLLEKLRIGILNMADYVAQHYSRYSSANNHLIVEIYSVGQCGFLFHYQPWIKLMIDTVTCQLPLQNNPDGVNREQAVVYQSFCMEALGLIYRLLVKNHVEVPPIWPQYLEKMCAYVADCRGEHGELIAFGDSDNGKIVDLQGGYDHIAFTQGMFSFLLSRRYEDLNRIDCENLRWMFTDAERKAAMEKPLYTSGQYRCYPQGGNTILTSRDGRVMIGIDHAPLGFGSICAHGHADALSFQIFVDGQPLFADPGTYIYHGDLKSRDDYRKTENHNTVCVDGKDQSQMLGPFLWGKRAECKLLEHQEEQGAFYLKASQDGYGVPVTRSFAYDGQNRLTLTDEVPLGPHFATFLTAPGFVFSIAGTEATLRGGGVTASMRFESDQPIHLSIQKKRYSPAYGVEEATTALVAAFDGNTMTTQINILPGGNDHE